MSEKELKEILFMELKKIAPECDPTEVNPDENIGVELNIDAYSFQQLLFGLSNSLGIDFSEINYERFFSVRWMMQQLSARIC